jgi:hypothetical protein
MVIKKPHIWYITDIQQYPRRKIILFLQVILWVLLDTSHSTTNLIHHLYIPTAQYGKYFPAQIMKLYGGVDVRIRAYLRTKQGDWLASQPARFMLAFSYSRALSQVQTDQLMGTP